MHQRDSVLLLLYQHIVGIRQHRIDHGFPRRHVFHFRKLPRMGREPESSSGRRLWLGDGQGNEVYIVSRNSASHIGLKPSDCSCRSLIEPKCHRRSLGRSRHHFGRHHSASSVTSATCASTLPDWRWFGSYPSLAYVANTVQLFGASVFWVSTLCGLPGILPSSGTAGGLEQVGQPEALWIGLYWGLQILGAPCFVVAGACFCIEVQDRWWRPKPFSIGWQM